MRRVGDWVPSRPRGVELGVGVKEASGGRRIFEGAARVEGPESRRGEGEGEGGQLLGLQRHLRRVATGKGPGRAHDEGRGSTNGSAGRINSYSGTRRQRRKALSCHAAIRTTTPGHGGSRRRVRPEKRKEGGGECVMKKLTGVGK